MENTNSAQWKQTILPMLPLGAKNILSHIEEEYPLEELRIRANQPLQLCAGKRDRLLYAVGQRPVVTREDCAMIFERICAHSVYAWEDEIKNGFITMEGGYRVGISGHAVRDEAGHIARITDIVAFNFRVPRACVGVSKKLLPYVLDEQKRPLPTLLLSPPGEGKTTLLRDLVRQLSYDGLRVFVADERMELSGSVRGVPQFDLGPRTDWLTGAGKAEAIALAVRTLSPQLIATDELGSRQEADAVQEAAFCGVPTIATAHVDSIQALCKRHTLMRLIQSGAILRVAQIRRDPQKSGYQLTLYDHQLNRLTPTCVA